MKWRPSPTTAARWGGTAIATLFGTLRWEIRDEAIWSTLQRAGHPFVFMLWHEALLPLLWHHRGQGIAIVVSEARDGQYLAAFAERLGYRCVLGSSTRGGSRALLEAVRHLRSGVPVAFTPDGPRGPRRELKPGILAAAARAGVPILPIHAVANRCWRLRSWDRFVIPKPFATVRVGYGTPQYPTKTDDDWSAAAATAVAGLNSIEKELAWPLAAATDIA